MHHHFLFKGVLNIYLLTRDLRWPTLKQYFRVDDELQDSNEIYLRLAIELDSELTAMTQRYQTTTQFVQNMRVAMPIALLSIAYSVFADTDVIPEVRGLLLILLFVISIYLYLFNTVRKHTSGCYYSSSI